jgi:cystathionine beta-lyase
MGIRLAQASASALTLAQWLEGRAEIARVLCPMLPGSPGHELWKRDFTGGCGLFSIVFKGKDSAARDAFVDGLSLFGIGSSFGGFESLATPVDPGRSRRPEAWPPAGTDSADRFAARISIGLEDPADLKADLERGLAAWAAA